MHAHLSSPAFLAYQAKAMCGAHRVGAIDSSIIFCRIINDMCAIDRSDV